MNRINTLLLAATLSSSVLFAQTQISNGGFENWGNASPGVSGEPTNWYSNTSGSNVAKLASITCFQDNSIKHTGNASVRLETISYAGTPVNGVITTGVVNAPSFTKSDGYIGTVNYSKATDDRREAFIGRPDSIVGWYQYTQGGATTELGKVRVILHTGDYYDPEQPTTYHVDPTANKIADALFLTPAANVSTWTRFSVAFNYNGNTGIPAYIMVNATSSDNQSTTVSGSKMWLDDIAVVYNSGAGINEINKEQNLKVFYSDKNLYIDFLSRSDEHSMLSIFDLNGKLVSSHKIENNKLNSINVSACNTGMYLYQLTGAAYQKTGKFIVD